MVDSYVVSSRPVWDILFKRSKTRNVCDMSWCIRMDSIFWRRLDMKCIFSIRNIRNIPYFTKKLAKLRLDMFLEQELLEGITRVYLTHCDRWFLKVAWIKALVRVCTPMLLSMPFKEIEQRYSRSTYRESVPNRFPVAAPRQSVQILVPHWFVQTVNSNI